MAWWPSLTAGSRAARITRSQITPLEMKVLVPLRATSSPSSAAVVVIEARSLPAPGSVMATAVTMSPLTQPGR